jgi:Zn-dependent peptidase ImmA (M78 family)
MTCPDCGSEETVKDSQGIYCKKCGLELEDAIINKIGRASRKKAESPVILPKLNFKIDPKKELYSLKLGLKYNKLSKDWARLLGFTLKNPLLKTELKNKALKFIEKAIDKHKNELEQAKTRMETQWKKINTIYWVEIEKLMDYKWQSTEYVCYLSMVCNGGFHNSSNNFIIIQYRWERLSNYVIAHELFHIIFRKYINRFFREKYNDFDEDFSEVVVNFVLLNSSKLKKLFPEIEFSFERYSLEKHKKVAEKILPLWKQKNLFKEFMINSYKKLGKDKKWISY